MLCAVLGTNRYTDGDGHLEDACRHGLPLSDLVEDLVTGTTDEVSVHELNDNASAAHCITDGRADDSSLGDGSVEETVVRNSLGQAAVYCVCAAPVTVVFTVSDEGGILVELIHDSLEETVTNLIYLCLCNGLAVFVVVGTNLVLEALVTSVFFLGSKNVGFTGGVKRRNVLVGEHDACDSIGILVEIHSGREVVIDSKSADLGHAANDNLVDSFKVSLGSELALDELFLVSLDRICFLPSLNLLVSTVGRGVGGAVTGGTVGNNVEKCGTEAVGEELLLAGNGVDNCERIVTVYALCVHLLGVEACAETSGHIVTHGLTAGLTAHAVEVVEYVEEDRESAVAGNAVLAPELLDLVHGSHVECFENGAASARAVTEVSDYDTLLLVSSLVDSSTESNGSSTANDRVVGHDAEGNEECVHRAAETAVEAGGSCEYLCECAVEEEVDRELLDVAGNLFLALNYLENASAEEFLHDVVKLFIGELVDGGKSLCKDLAVAAVRTEGKVVDVEAVGFTYCRCFLTERKVSRAGVVVFNAVVNALGLDLVEHGLELADDTHVAVDAKHIVLGVDLLFLCEGLVVLTYGNVFKVNVLGGKDLIRINVLTLRHDLYLLVNIFFFIMGVVMSGRRTSEYTNYNADTWPRRLGA